MSVKFNLYFKTPELYDRLVPLLGEIPGYFVFDLKVGTPAVQIISETDPLWIGFPFPVNAGDVYVFDDDILAGAAGGGGDMRASIRISRGDPDDVAIMRIWHELLHAIGQPADDMERLAPEWQKWYERILWRIWPHLFGTRHCPFWHRRFYVWLTKRAETSMA